ncbi:condensation domain-containing protein, partial [Streptomyces sp. NPDC058171]
MAQQLAPDSPLYNCATYVEISGHVDAVLLSEAVRRTVAETDALRVRFTEDEDGLWQVVAPAGDGVSVPVLDVSDTPDPDATARAWMADDLATPVDPTSDTLYAHALFRTGDERFLLYFRHHHIALDGYGQATYLGSLARTYTALAAGQEPPATRSRPLAELLEQEREYRTAPRHDEDRAYWHTLFADEPEPTPLTGRAADPAPAALRRTVRLAADGTPRFTETGRWPVVLVAAVAAYVHRLTGAEDVVVGLPMTARTTALALSTPAMLSNELPVRLSVTRDTTLTELVRQVTDRIGGALRHQRYRGEDLRRHMNLSGATGTLNSVTVNAMSFGQRMRFGGHETVLHPLSTGPVKDLYIASFGDPADSEDGVLLEFDGNPALYSEDELASHQDRFVDVLATLTTDPDRPVGSVDLVGAAERRRLLVEWNATDTAAPAGDAVELFRACAARTPQAVALVYGDVTLTYAELDARSERLAGLLAAQGVRPERYVAVSLPRSPDLVAALLAVLKAGGAYLPLDADFPPARLAHMTDETSPVLVLDEQWLADADRSTAEQRPAAELPRVTEAAQAAYVLFTSGSTGRPKGVVVSRAALANVLADMRARLPLVV